MSSNRILKGPEAKRFFRQGLCLGAAVLCLTVGLTVGKAMAYFTTYARSEGIASVSLDFPHVDVEETVTNLTKHITIVNTGEADCYVRVKVLAGEKYQEQLAFTLGDGWGERQEDGYFYYHKILKAQGTEPESDTRTTVLDAAIALKDQTGAMAGGVASEVEKDGLKDFNIIVVAECTPVFYDSQGNAQYSWDAAEPILGEGGF